MPRKLTIENAQALAESKGGRCLSEKYINAHSKMKWECKSTHKFVSTYNHIQCGGWCPYCSGRARLTINNAVEFAKSKMGRCLSNEYEFKNGRSKLDWQCSVGHVWKARMSHIVNGFSWCPYCSGKRKLYIDDFKELAIDNGGECLSEKYIVGEKMRWKCGSGHIWYASYDSVWLGKHWCPYCSGNAKLSINHARSIAVLCGGKCLSTKYINNSSKLIWECCEKHVWKASYSKVNYGTWCPECSIYKNQKKLAEIMSDILNEKSESIRPSWLKNPRTGRNLEIDIYFKSSKIAVEYNGIQHYKPINFSGSLSNEQMLRNLIELKYRDKLKRKLAKNNSNKIKHFITFTYRNIIEGENIKNILIKRGII